MPSLLPDYFERDLVRTAQFVAGNALPDADVNRLNSLAKEFQSVFDTALASIFRAYNSKHSQQHRLPNEIWCHVWEYLPWRSTMAVSRVCHMWRCLALSSPRLWCAVYFSSSMHSEECDCDECRYPDGSDESSVDMYTAGSSNFNETIALIPRSQPLPFNLYINISASYADLDVVTQLADFLAPHSQRIGILQFSSEDPSAAHAFFSRFPTLPRLTSLVVDSPENGEDDAEEIVPGPGSTILLLPSLRRLTLTGGIGVQLRFKNLLTFLDCPYISAYDLRGCLQQATNLQQLKLHMPDHHPGSEGLDALKDACARVPTVDVINISQSTEQDATHLLDSRYRELTFSYETACQYNGLCVLATILQPTWFSLLRHGNTWSERLLLTVGDGAHKRTLSLPLRRCLNDSAMTAAWDAYPAQLYAPAATVDLTLLPRVPQRIASMVTSLVVEMPASAVGPPPTGIPSFPALQTVEFRCDMLRPPAHYSEAAIFSVGQFLRREADRKLKTIVIANVLLDGGNSLLSSIANDVVRVARVAPSYPS